MAKSSKASGSPTASAVALDPAACRARLEAYWSDGKTRDALDLAKQFLKTAGGADAEALVLDAYEAHVRALMARRMYPEARHLASTVIERFRRSRDRFAPLVRRAGDAAAGDIHALLGERDAASDQRRLELDVMLARETRNLRAIAESPALREDDPLRHAARVAAELFTAVTTGPVPPDALAPLAAIPRQSPLAPWKLVIRAIAAYYRCDDTSASANVSAMPADCAPAPLGAAVRALAGGSDAAYDQTRTPAVQTLLHRVSGGQALLRWYAGRLVQEVASGDDARAAQALQDMLPRLEAAPASIRHTALATIVHHWTARRLKLEPLLRALLRDPRDPDALRFGALVLDQHGDWPDAVLVWDAYRAAAVRAGTLRPEGPEMGRLLLHMAEQFPSDPEDIRDEFDVESDAELEALLRAGELPNCMDRAGLLARARAADPSPAAFRALVRHYDARDPQAAEAEAKAWRRQHPRDLEPILYIVRAAERRGAFQKALRVLADAESINQVHPDVRRSRFRLLLATAERRIRDAEPDLADRALDELDHEPGAGEGDTGAYLLALRWAVERRRGDASAAARVGDTLTARTGNPALTHLTLTAVARLLEVEETAVPGGAAAPAQSVEALARAAVLFRKLERALFVPPELAARAEQDVGRASTAHLHALCAAGLAIGRPSLTYAASGVGLARDAGSVHRFLLIRGRALQMAAAHREHERAERCFRAARELAGRARDLDAVREASAALAEISARARAPGFAGWRFLDEEPLTPEETARVVADERSRQSLPRFTGAPPRRRRRRRAAQRQLFDDLAAPPEPQP